MKEKFKFHIVIILIIFLPTSSCIVENERTQWTKTRALEKASNTFPVHVSKRTTGNDFSPSNTKGHDTREPEESSAIRGPPPTAPASKLTSPERDPQPQRPASTLFASSSARLVSWARDLSPGWSQCILCGDSCTSDDLGRKYQWRMLTETGSSTVADLLSFVDQHVCTDDSMRTGLETAEENQFLVDCFLCHPNSGFGASQTKGNILTSAKVTVARDDLSLENVIEGSFGMWHGWGTEIRQLASSVVRIDPDTGQQITSGLVPQGDYTLLLMGREQLSCLQNSSGAFTTYQTWGLLPYDGQEQAIQVAMHTVCEKVIARPTTTPKSTTETPTHATTTEHISTDSSTTTSPQPSTTSSTTLTTTTSQVTTKLMTTSTTPKFPATTVDPEECCCQGRQCLCPGNNMTEKCDESHVGERTVTCIDGEVVVVKDDCLYQWIDDAMHMLTSGNVSATDIASGLKNHTQEQTLSPHDLDTLVEIISNLTVLIDDQVGMVEDAATRKALMTNYTESLLGLTSNILAVEGTWVDLKLSEAAEQGSSLLRNLEVTGFNLAEEVRNDTVAFQESQVNMTVHSVPRETLLERDLFFPSPSDRTFLHLPPGFEALLPERETQARLVGFLLHFEAAARVLPGVLNRNLTYPRYKKVNSHVVSMSLGNATHSVNFTSLGEGVLLRLEHAAREIGPVFRDLYRDQRPGEVPTPVPGTAKCVYWDHDTSVWSPDGCNLVNTTHDVTFCQCNHLTMISIITDIHDYVGRDPVLDIMGTVLTSASCISLFLAFCIFQFCKGLAQTPRRNISKVRISINKQLCVSLGISHGLLLFLLDRDFLKLSETGCSISAMVLHYWVTSGVCWMLAEGGHLFQTVQRVLSPTHYMPAYWMIGYGFPLVIVLITVLVSYANDSWLGQKAYAPEGSEYCWLSTDQGYIWSFTGPLVAVIVLNTICLILALRSAAILEANKQKTLPQQLRMWIKGCFSLNCVLGTTWVFGLLYLNTSHFFAYVFTIFNGSQGVMILVLHCLVNDTVREALVNAFPDAIKKHLQQHPRNRQSALSTSRAQSQGPRRRVSVPSSIHLQASSTSSTSFLSSSTRRLSEPNLGQHIRRPSEAGVAERTVQEKLQFLLPGELGGCGNTIPPSRWSRRLKRDETRFPECEMCASGRDDPYNAKCTCKQGATPNPSPPRKYRNNRSGSEWSNATQLTFISDGQSEGPYSTRRTSFDSYGSSVSDESSESSGHFVEHVGISHRQLSPRRTAWDLPVALGTSLRPRGPPLRPRLRHDPGVRRTQPEIRECRVLLLGGRLGVFPSSPPHLAKDARAEYLSFYVQSTVSHSLDLCRYKC
ncbi:adhesion G protein-coupled receptor L2-like [Penaeus chinensis]|uniref:adhesion G protein-coupled receptor L2-like n=1 Tax=Penaeus chinensis TaxID=139456 RepID=UPI001FB6F50A|nr:adhesion G protein-coupled receptor L2-like [Penaeus chinensis]